MDRKYGNHIPASDGERPGGKAGRGEPMPDSLAEVDPVMHRFQEAPYDELASATGGGRLIGFGATSVTLRGWIRPVAYLMSLSMIAFFAIAVDIIAIQIFGSHDTGRDLYAMASAALLGIPFGIAGVLLLWRLITTRQRTSHEIEEGNAYPSSDGS